ncbi:hypothetical protein [Mycolicibacterium fortuitum]|uniref:hypothetical protein n=1 Tax=Mycolicibacterium fortuitum TaxID=1766 RepID=UPI000A53C7AF|nr:hypothetical protein [Mycolicibacterium fortuitum]
MTTPIESSRRASTLSASGIGRRAWWRSAPAAGLVLAGAILAILLGISTDVQWVTVLASFAGFATAITVIAAVATSWEHVVVNARSAGLVETEVESR